MAKNEDQSLGDQHTLDGGAKDTGPQSLGDEETAGGADSSVSDVSSLDDAFDDDMEVVELSARYTIEDTLGKGGMGEVLLATDTRLGRKVAIKRILGEGARSRTAVSRFLTEAKSIAALNHSNIVQVHDYGRDNDGPFLIMEYVDGGSLLDHCQQGALPLEEAVELTCQLCDGLGKAHEANIIHRDIKPANVLLTKDGIPKLTDFGLAKDEAADTGLSVAGAVLGTLDFMPSEQWRDAALTDARSDLWSLAATLYQMVTGRAPKVIRLDLVHESLRAVLGQALEDEKEKRYQTAAEFRDALQGCLKAAESAPEVAVDLGAGECPQCHAKNESSRKFCRGCGDSLEVPCLSCSTGIPVWEEFCGGCGTKQSALAEQRRAETNSIGMQFRLLPSGTFTMGESREAHKVTLTKPFYFGVHEVTQQQYEKVMGKNPSKYKGPQNPVEGVSWNEAVEFCRRLSELLEEKEAGHVYRLPTEAEWEYSCRAGTTTKYSFGDSDSQLSEYGWFVTNSGKSTHPVGQKKPNPWGLYDMHGNVWEWCRDWHSDYPSGSVDDPQGPSGGSLRVARGGSWFNVSDYCRSAGRGWITPDDRFSDCGFRVLRSSVK